MMIGTVLSNRYKLTAELGSGGMAWIYLAEDLREERRVAVKILYPQLSQDLGFLQRFAQEAKLAMSLCQSDPEMHVARVFDYGSDQDIHYLVMEYVEGRDLRRVLTEDGPLAWQEALDVARQVALALAHAHRHGIVHRDIKSENIMILPDGTARVLDFGVARARTSPSLTQSGFVGSPNYAAPEQAMGRPVDIRADLYSLGVVLCEMLTGKLPFESDTPWAVITQHIAAPPPMLEESHPNIPAPAARLVRRAMAKRPEDRFQTPAEMVQVIEAVLLGVDLPLETPAAEPDVLIPLLAGLYQRAEQAVQANLWQEAVDLFSQILRLDPRYRDVTDQLAEAGRQARLSALYAAARRSLKTGQWAEALAQLDEISATAPDYRDVRELRAWAGQKHQLDQLYRQGLQHLETGEWAAAFEYLTKVHDQDPGYAKAGELLSTARAELDKQQHLVEATRRAGQHVVGHNRPSTPPGRDSLRSLPPRRRSLLWALVAILILALAVETALFYRAQQTQVTAAAFAPTATAATAWRPTASPWRSAPAPLPSPSPLLQPTPAWSPTPRPTQTRRPSGPSATLTPSDTPSPSATRTPLPAAILSPTATSSPAAIPTSRPTATPTRPVVATSPPPLTGQIAFPRFDPVRGTYDIYLCLVDGTGCRRLAAEASQPDLLPDGTQLAFHSWKPDDKGLALQTLEGRRVWRITDQMESARPSSDSHAVVYHSRQAVDRLPRLYRTYDAETRPILQGAGPVLGHSPSWLPDGRILYSGCVGNDCGIIVMNGDGTYARQVTAGSAETNPEASPDGRQIAFMSQRDGNWEVYVVDVDGANLRRLTDSPADDGLPAWSPDGRMIAFVSNRGGPWAIWVMRPDGSGQRSLFAIGGPLDGRVQNAALHETYGWVEERISWSRVP